MLAERPTRILGLYDTVFLYSSTRLGGLHPLIHSVYIISRARYMGNIKLPGQGVVAYSSTWIDARINIHRSIVLVSSGVRTDKHMEVLRVVVDPPRRINLHKESIVRSIRDFGGQFIPNSGAEPGQSTLFGLCPDGWL